MVDGVVSVVLPLPQSRSFPSQGFADVMMNKASMDSREVSTHGPNMMNGAIPGLRLTIDFTA